MPTSPAMQSHRKNVHRIAHIHNSVSRAYFNNGERYFEIIAAAQPEAPRLIVESRKLQLQHHVLQAQHYAQVVVDAENVMARLDEREHSADGRRHD